MPALTPKQERFVAEYLVDLNATQAAIRAGYSPKTANQQGPRLLVNDGIAAAVAEQQTKHLQRADLTATRVLQEIKRISFSDIRRVFNEYGNLKPVSELSDDEAAAIGSVEVVIKNAAAGDGHTDTIHKIKHWDKLKALELAGRHLGMFEENASVSGTIELVWGRDSSA